MESFRRRQGQAPNNAGIPGGAQAAGQISPTNPLAAQNRLQGGVGGSETASAGAAGQLGQSKPSEAEIIVKALIQRLKNLTPQPQQQQVTQGV